ncbi:MAG: hypothetical protein K6T16_00665 [Candidatus Pacearchaeota archaeon]|nr:hypothetical protein [Candidatus Pacearchaeota archaeon]
MRMKKEALLRKEVLLLAVFLLAFPILFISLARADIYMGTCEGYVFFLNGSGVGSGANVTVTVVGCTTPPENCVRSVLTDSNSYYVIANLNLPPYGNVSATAKKGVYYGTNTGQADQFQAAFVNITMCEAPTSATLVPVADSHYPNITFWFNWTSGSSPYPTFDQWYWQGSWQTASSPQSKTNLAFANYTWGARTCLSSLPSCCSPPAYDNFSVYNARPCMPILTPQNDTHNNTVVLNWTSNTTGSCPDADNDTTYYNFRIDGNLSTNATPPKTVSGLSFGPHTWQVQECDPWECSDWATDTFNVGNNPCPAPNLTAEPDTCVNQALLEWVSASVDSEGDPCIDEFYFQGITQSPASSPQTVIMTTQDMYTWRVRSCDNYGACSAWVEDKFIFCTCPSIIEEADGGRGAGRGGCVLPAGYEIVFSVPRDVYPGESFEIKMSLKYFISITNLTIETESPEKIEVERLNYGPVLGNKEITTKLKGKIPEDFREGTYYLFVKGYNNGDLLFNKPVEIRVVSPPTTIVSFMRLPALPCCLFLGIIIILIIIAATVWASREIYKKMRQKQAQKNSIFKKIKESV